MEKRVRRPRPKVLGIRGKLISVEKIGEKSKAQFAAQLKQNGIVLSDKHLQGVYDMLQRLVEQEKAWAAEDAAAQAAEATPAEQTTDEATEEQESAEEAEEVKPTNTEE